MSWGNPQNTWNDQDMDSQGKKLSVNGSGGGAPSNYRVHIEELSGSNAALDVLGSTRLRNLSSQTSPLLKVDGDANAGGYRAEIIDASNESKALKTDGSIHIWRGGAVRGRFTPGADLGGLRVVFKNNMGQSPQSNPD